MVMPNFYPLFDLWMDITESLDIVATLHFYVTFRLRLVLLRGPPYTNFMLEQF